MHSIGAGRWLVVLDIEKTTLHIIYHIYDITLIMYWEIHHMSYDIDYLLCYKKMFHNSVILRILQTKPSKIMQDIYVFH